MGSRQKSPSSRGFQGTLLSWFPLLPAARPASSLSRRPHWHWVRTRPSPPAHSEGVTPPAPGPRCPPAPPGKACPPLTWTVSRPERLFSALSPASLANPSSHSHTANLTRLAALSAWRPFPNQCLPSAPSCCAFTHRVAFEVGSGSLCAQIERQFGHMSRRWTRARSQLSSGERGFL